MEPGSGGDRHRHGAGELSEEAVRTVAERVQARRAPTVRIDDPPPGQEEQIGFGQVGYVTTAAGHRRKLCVLVVTRSMSRDPFVFPTFVQTVEALCEGPTRLAPRTNYRR